MCLFDSGKKLFLKKIKKLEKCYPEYNPNPLCPNIFINFNLSSILLQMLLMKEIGTSTQNNSNNKAKKL